MITLSNSHLHIEIDESCGCDVLFLSAHRDGPNALDKRGWQTWLKRGTTGDAATGVLSNFYGDSRTEAYSVSRADESELVAVWHAPAGEIGIEKTLRLQDATLIVETRVFNAGAQATEPLQVEQFICFAGGNLAQRADHVTRVRGDGADQIIRLESFAQRYVMGFAGDARLEVAGKDWGIALQASDDTMGAMAVIFAKLQARGFFSQPFSLEAGQSYSYETQMRWLDAAELADLKAAAICATTPQPSRASAKTDVLAALSGTPIFAHRWSHLCLQYDRVSPDDLRKIIGEMLVPLGYNGVILEIDRGVRLNSHPELSESWSLSLAQLQETVKFCRAQGLKVGLEFNTPGHQNETNLLRAHPELAEDATIKDRPPLCVSHPGSRRLVGEVIGELIEACSPDLFHFGGDEAQFAGTDTSTFGRCPLCRGQSPAQLWASWVQWLSDLLPPQVTPMIFGDCFLQDAQFGAHDGGNGTLGEIWRAIDQLPPRFQISDWHYFAGETYPSLDFFAGRGHVVWPTIAFNLDATAAFAKDAQKRGIDRLLHTTWAVPGAEKLPIESMVWAAFYAHLGQSADELPVRQLSLDFCRNFW